mmetsp:Transcript_25767/g.33774  ORF Transcript_25767/g.33774 Transcript_25767/m.33774 type:complete len:578 (+) Transcript_25767:143-1876(+)
MKLTWLVFIILLWATQLSTEAHQRDTAHWDIPGRPQDPYIKNKPMCHYHGTWELIDYEPMRSKYPPKSDSWKKPETTLWIGIASFRDVLCSRTLYNIFTKAEYPERITVGVVEQKLDSDSFDCLEDYCARFGGQECPHKDQVTVTKVNAVESTGPCFGRALQFHMLKDEEFCMQTDSHMDFDEHWDTHMFNQWGMINNEYAVISTYVQDLEKIGVNVNGVWEMAHLCEIIWAGDMPRNEQAKACRTLSEPKLTTVWAAGLSFLKCHGERQTPYDPHLPGIFDGEEYTKGIRLWTRGYDMYTPHRSHVYHDYNHPKIDNRAHTWKRTGMPESKARIKTLLEMKDGDHSPEAKARLGIYGLGEKRSLDQYIEFSGVDIRNRKAFKNSCGNIAWIPFEEDPNDEAIRDNVRRGYIRDPLHKDDPVQDGNFYEAILEFEEKADQDTLDDSVLDQHNHLPDIESEKSERKSAQEEERRMDAEQQNIVPKPEKPLSDDHQLRHLVQQPKDSSQLEQHLRVIEIDLRDTRRAKEAVAVLIFIFLMLFGCLSYYYHRRDVYMKSYIKKRKKHQRFTVRESQSKLV